MTIRKGEPWGSERPTAEELEECRSDADAAARVWGRRSPNPLGADSVSVMIDDGDLLRTVGGQSSKPVAGSVRLHLPMDLGLVSIDGAEAIPFAAHVVVRRRLWQGEFAVVMNAAWCGRWYLGPRAHPNDGLLDVTTGALGLRDRVEARRRAVTGTHLPHPDLTTIRSGSWRHRFAKPTPVLVDGIQRGSVTQLECELVSDAFSLVI